MASLQLHHNFPKLAEESGFSFNIHKPRVHIEWNKIKLINIENLIRDRRFVLIEQHINDILDCSLESEFDVRILDEGVLKIFRLSQLAVEYQQFCRNYLDRSVHVLREEVTNLLKELEIVKRSVKDKDEEIRRLKRKTKHSVRNALPYSNENIATMLLKTLNNSKEDIFGSTSHGVELQYNKCSYCDKVFLNQLYLKSHISRRHGDCLEIPQKDNIEKVIVNENTHTKLNEEIEELKSKLKQMEEYIKNTSNNFSDKAKVEGDVEKNLIRNAQTGNKEISKEMKDAEVLTEENVKVIDKVEQWKKEEYEKYNQEIILLRKQIIDIISNKEKQDQSSLQNELKIMEQLRETIKQQGSEILALKEELLKEEKNEKDKRRVIETQMSYWIKQSEVQSNEYKALLQKLNEVANEAREYRARADAEKEKSCKLEELLQEHLNTASPKKTSSSSKNKVTEKTVEVNKSNNMNSPKITSVAATADIMTLTKLQQKAQELLNINETSTCDSTSTSEDNIKQKKVSKGNWAKDKTQKDNTKKQIMISSKSRRSSQSYDEIDQVKHCKNKLDKKSKKKTSTKNAVVKNKTSKTDNGYVHIPSSPIKVVRAKITEEVNHRLIALGVDPLKNRLPENSFQKPRMLLQKNHETKTKKFPAREKILHSIIAHLDKNTSSKVVVHNNDYISPNKSSKTFSLASVLTNVKTKALSLVKSNDFDNKPDKSYNDVAKKAMALLRTPPGSTHSSPSIHQQSVSPEKNIKKVVKSKNKVKYQPSKLVTPKKKIETVQESDISDDTNDSESIDNVLNQEETSKVVNNLVKSPIRHPKDISVKDNVTNNNYFFNNNDKSSPNTQDKNEQKAEVVNVSTKSFFENKQDSSDLESIADLAPRKFLSDENINFLKQTKGVLKNASSTSSLNKKKVLFDMEAIQMKSVSASPSQSITEKSTHKEQESSIVNLDTEEWDISSIENEPQKSDIKVQITSHTSPKIAELKNTIESQLNRRNPTLSTALVGGVDVLSTPIQKASFGGSNTSLGSSILDETESIPTQNKKAFFKPRALEKDDSEIEISDLINEAVENKNYVKSY